MTDRIDHAAEALRVIMALPSGDTLDQAYAYAQVHATLALAEQARIANLIALAALVGQPTTHESLSDAAYGALDALLGTVIIGPEEEHVVLDSDIAAALGIETGAGGE